MPSGRDAAGLARAGTWPRRAGQRGEARQQTARGGRACQRSRARQTTREDTHSSSLKIFSACDAVSSSLATVLFSDARRMPSFAAMPRQVPACEMASIAYSTWYRRPGGGPSKRAKEKGFRSSIRDTTHASSPRQRQPTMAGADVRRAPRGFFLAASPVHHARGVYVVCGCWWSGLCVGGGARQG